MRAAAFLFNSILLGAGLAMDAFSVSLANGLNEAGMKKGRMCRIAGTFAGFQILMPLIGWFCVNRIAEAFEAFRRFIPWIALILLVFIGGKMMIEGLRKKTSAAEKAAVGFWALMLQGIATSIDALSVGFAIAEYSGAEALAASLIIGAVTFAICMGGLFLGRRFGMKLADKASILGGLILIAIGAEIFISSMI